MEFWRTITLNGILTINNAKSKDLPSSVTKWLPNYGSDILHFEVDSPPLCMINGFAQKGSQIGTDLNKFHINCIYVLLLLISVIYIYIRLILRA
jgi:hypothetical protein